MNIQPYKVHNVEIPRCSSAAEFKRKFHEVMDDNRGHVMISGVFNHSSPESAVHFLFGDNICVQTTDFVCSDKTIESFSIESRWLEADIKIAHVSDINDWTSEVFELDISGPDNQPYTLPWGVTVVAAPMRYGLHYVKIPGTNGADNVLGFIPYIHVDVDFINRMKREEVYALANITRDRIDGKMRRVEVNDLVKTDRGHYAIVIKVYEKPEFGPNGCYDCEVVHVNNGSSSAIRSDSLTMTVVSKDKEYRRE